MVTLLTSNNSALFKQLSSKAFQRAGVRYSVVSSGRDALEAVRREPPAMAILDVDLPEVDGYEVCRSIKADPALSGVRVMLVLSSVVSREQLDKLASSGCDDLFFVPAPSEELYEHVAPLIGLPVRGSRRVPVQLRARLTLGAPGNTGRNVAARLINLSLEGAKVGLQEPLGVGREVHLRIERDEFERAAVVRAKVVWERKEDQEFAINAGLQFQPSDTETKRAIAALSLWDVTSIHDGAELIGVQGDFTESSDFRDLARHLGRLSVVELDLSGVRYLNSWGVRAWIELLDGLPPKLDYTFVRVSVAMITQASMVTRVLGRGRVESFFAPYLCERCDRSEERLLQVAAISGERLRSPKFLCPACGGPLELDEIPERYFAFLS